MQLTKTKEDVLEMRLVSAVRQLSCDDFRDRRITETEVSHIFNVCDALWLHSGNPKDPHATTTQGKHCTNGYIDVLRAIRFTNLCELLAHELIEKMEEIEVEGKLDAISSHSIDWVIGSDHAAAAFSHAMATCMGAQHDFTEKGPNGTQLWKRLTIEPDEYILQVEELVTTTSTLEAVRAGIRIGNAKPVNFAPFIATLVHRSSVYEIEGAPIIYLVHYDIDTWEPSECPLCAAGSERIIEPKKNWARLTGKP